MMTRSGKLWLLALVLLGVGVRFHGLFANTFHADEALFASWARLIATWRDPLLQTQMVDKPPLLFYVQALFYPLMATPAGWVARLPNLIASMLLIPLSGRVVWHLYRDSFATLIAATFVALSPFAIQFSATAFTDPLLTTLLVAALTIVASGRWQVAGNQSPVSNHQSLISGILFGLAVATKHQAWLFLPLLLALGTMGGWRWQQWRRWLLGAVPVLLAVVLWDVARTGGLSLWALQWEGVGGTRPVWSWELWPRLAAWGDLWRILLGSPILSFGLVLALPPVLALLIDRQDWPTAYDQVFVLFLLGYFGLHWFLAVPVWDRYLLPLVPVVALLLGRGAARVVAFVEPELPLPAGKRLLSSALVVALLLVQLPVAVSARQGRFPVGGRPSADAGAAEIAALLDDAPYGTVLYDHWYSWQWRYHLLDTGVYVSWFPHPAGLVEDLAVFGGDGSPRYLVLPAGEVARPVRRAVADAGFGLELVAPAGEMRLYRVVPR